MLKRCLGILLALSLILAIPSAAFGEIITKTAVDMDSENYTYTLTVTASDSDAADAEISYQWYECDSSGSNAKTVSGAVNHIFKPEKSEDTKYYYCEVTSTTADGSYSKSTEVLTIINKTPEEDATKILTFSVKDIDEPVTGEKPDTKANIVSNSGSEAGYTITSVSWEPTNSQFQPETVYTVTVNVKLDEGFVTGDNFKCLINNSSALTVGNASSGEFGFCYTFAATKAAEAEPSDQDPATSPDTENDANKPLPSPLGIPGWIWAAIILILAAGIIVALIASGKNKKKRSTLQKIEAEKKAVRRKSDIDTFDDEDDDDNLPGFFSNLKNRLFKDDDDDDDDDDDEAAPAAPYVRKTSSQSEHRPNNQIRSADRHNATGQNSSPAKRDLYRNPSPGRPIRPERAEQLDNVDRSEHRAPFPRDAESTIGHKAPISQRKPGSSSEQNHLPKKANSLWDDSPAKTLYDSGDYWKQKKPVISEDEERRTKEIKLPKAPVSGGMPSNPVKKPPVKADTDNSPEPDDEDNSNNISYYDPNQGKS